MLIYILVSIIISGIWTGSDHSVACENSENSNVLVNLEDFNYLLESPVCDVWGQKELLGLIIVTSYVGHVEMRTSHRQSISQSELNEMGLARVFLLAEIPEHEQRITQEDLRLEFDENKDLLQGNFQDAYRHNTYKNIMGLKWGSEKCPDAKFIIKLDDDTVYDVFFYQKFLKERETELDFDRNNFLAGSFSPTFVAHRSNSKYTVTVEEYPYPAYPPYLSGYFYITTPQVARKFVKLSESTKFFWIDDVYITGILRGKANITVTDLGKWSCRAESLKCIEMDQSTEQLLSSPSTSTQNCHVLPPIVNYETHPLIEPQVPPTPSFFLGSYRPEPLYAIRENEGYSSLPPDINSTKDQFFIEPPLYKPPCWEAEDTEEFIATLNEFGMISNGSSNTPSLITVAADVHYNLSLQSASSSRPSSHHSSQMIHASGGPVEKYPKFMTASCYGELTNPFLPVKSDDEISLINKSTDNLLDGGGGCMAGGPKMSDFNSMTSSIMTSSTGSNRCLENSFLEGSERSFDIKLIAENDLQAIKKLLENETGGCTCPCCEMPFDKGKKRKLIDTCGHEKCYTCVFTNEQCPLCQEQMNNRENDLIMHSGKEGGGGGISTHHQRISDYDTGIGSTSTIISPIGSPYGQIRSHVKTNGHFTSYMQSRQDLASPDFNHTTSLRPTSKGAATRELSQQCCIPAPQIRGLGDITTSAACATPPQNRRRLFSPKSLRSPFGARRSNTTNLNQTINSTLSDDEGGNVKPVPLQNPTKSKASQDELQVRLGFFLENNNTRRIQQSCSSLTSANTSPVSTLTGSSEADVRPHHQYNRSGCDSIGSMMSVSISGHSNDGSASPVSRRHSVTATMAGGNQLPPLSGVDEFKNRKTAIRRSARVGQVKGVLDPKIRFAQYRPAQLTLKPLFFEVPQQEPDPLFVGRHWLLRELSNTLSTTESPGILLHGNPGTGKTALLLQLVEYSCFGRKKDIPSLDTDGIYCQVNVVYDRIRSFASHVVAYHFCQSDNYIYCLVPDFIHSLAAQLCQAPQLAAFREHLLSEPHLQNILSVKDCIADPYRAMRMGILEPLSTLRRVGKISGKNCIILIDGLCEAEYHRPDHGDTIGSFLSKMMDYFPSWLKIVATIQTPFLEIVKGLPYTKMSLNWMSNEGVQKDLFDYITFRVNHSTCIQNNISGGGGRATDSAQGNFKFAQHLLGLTNGSFLYTKLALDLVERGNLVIKSTSYKVLPVSLPQIFLLNFNLRFPTSSAFEKVSPILSVCLAALYPLTLAEIFYAVNALKTEEFELSWDDFTCNFKMLQGFLIKRIDSTYMFFHPSFREWLMRRDESESSKFICDPRIGHAALAFRLSRMMTPLNAEQTLELGHHILKAHIYRTTAHAISSRDLQSFWISSVTDDISASLSTLRNVYSPNIKVSRLLLLSGSSPDHVTDFHGNAPLLCIAANEGIVPMVSLLLEFGADVEKSNSQGCTPLILASAKGHCDVVRLITAAGATLGHVDTSQRCALIHAARADRRNVVKYLIACEWTARPGTNDILLKDAAQQALIAAASQGCLEIVEDLLDMSEVVINGMDSLTGETALTTAAMNGYTETVSTLLSRSAAVDAKNRKEMSPLLLAVKEGHWAVADRLLQHNADLEQEDSSGKTALMVAAEEGHVGIIELLLNRGASLTKCDREGLTALSWACLRGRLQAAKCLLERNADKHHSDNVGRTPLDLAAYQGSAALVQMLIENGGKIEHVDINGMRPLDRAIACRNVQVVQVFLKRGAKLGPATWAMAAGKPEILLLLLNKLLEDGNILYRKSRIQEAAHRYQYALKKIPVNESSPSSSHHGTFIQLKFNFLLNYSRCRRKMNDISEAIDLASQAIELKPENYDGYFARAKSYFEYGNHSEALRDIQLALERSQSTTLEIKGVLIRLRDDILHKKSDTTDSIDEITSL